MAELAIPAADSQSSVIGIDQFMEKTFHSEQKEKLEVFQDAMGSLVPLLTPLADSTNERERDRVERFQELQERAGQAISGSEVTMSALSDFVMYSSEARACVSTLTLAAELKQTAAGSVIDDMITPEMIQCAKRDWAELVEGAERINLTGIIEQLQQMSQDWKSLSMDFIAEAKEWKTLKKDFKELSRTWESVAKAAAGLTCVFTGIAAAAVVVVLCAPVAVAIVGGTCALAAAAYALYRISKYITGQTQKAQVQAEEAEAKYKDAGASAEEVSKYLKSIAAVAKRCRVSADATKDATKEARSLFAGYIKSLMTNFPDPDKLEAFLLSNATNKQDSETVMNHQQAFSKLQQEVDKFRKELRSMNESLDKTGLAIDEVITKAEGRQKQGHTVLGKARA